MVSLTLNSKCFSWQGGVALQPLSCCFILARPDLGTLRSWWRGAFGGWCAIIWSERSRLWRVAGQLGSVVKLEWGWWCCSCNGEVRVGMKSVSRGFSIPQGVSLNLRCASYFMLSSWLFLSGTSRYCCLGLPCALEVWPPQSCKFVVLFLWSFALADLQRNTFLLTFDWVSTVNNIFTKQSKLKRGSMMVGAPRKLSPTGKIPK